MNTRSNARGQTDASVPHEPETLTHANTASDDSDLTPLDEPESVNPPVSSNPSQIRPNIDSQLDRLIQVLAAQQEQITSLLQGRTRDVSTTTTVQGHREPKVKDPETFDGKRDSLKGFLTQCQIVFDLQSTRFESDSIRIKYVVSLLRGTPLNAVRPYVLLEDKPDWMISYSAFTNWLLRNYGDPDEKGTAERRLQSLTQRGSASTYFADFQQHAAVLGWPDAPLVSLAIRGLKDDIKDQLALRGERPATMTELIDVVVRLDNRIYERSQEKRQGENRSTPDRAKSASTHDTNRDDKRSNSTQNRPISTFRPSTSVVPVSTKREPLSEQEKDYRRSKGLCLYCGKPGHILSACPSKPATLVPTQSPSALQPVFGQLKVSAPSK